MKQLKKETFEYVIDNEEEAINLIQEFKDNQSVDGYTLVKYKNDYKCKKDKSGEVLEEKWITSVTKQYEVV